MNHHINIVRIKAVHNLLGELNSRVVFVGGATVSLYADRITLSTRPTDDVDIIIEILNYSSRIEIEDKLRSLGFYPHVESGIICRYKIQGITVDIIPTTPDSIGFSNKWYPEGFKNAVNVKLDENTLVKILSSPYFIATKLEAFKSRGNGDGRISQDFEDIVFVLENRQTIWSEMNNAPKELRKYLRKEFTRLKANPYIFEWIDCHTELGSPPNASFILIEIEKFIK